MQDWCGLALCRQQQLCSAGSAAYTSATSVGSGSTLPEEDLTPLGNQGSVGKRCPQQWGFLVWESLLEQLSEVMADLQLSALPSRVPALAGPVGLGSAVGHLGQGGWEILTRAAGAAGGAWSPVLTPALTPWPFPGSWGCCRLPCTSLHEPAEDGSDRRQLGKGPFARCWDVIPLKMGVTNGLVNCMCGPGTCAARPIAQ